MKVITKDFQILKGTVEWEFPVGVTIIQGESGNGKSTLIYAIQDCLCNPSGVDDVINWDAKQTEVTIQNNDSCVKWIKTHNSSTYINVNTGDEYIKASKLDSRDIGDLGFYFDSKNRVVNIHDEWSKLFPFGSSDTEMFKLFEDIFNISSSFKIIEEIKEDERDIKTQITNVNTAVNKLKEQNLQIDKIFSQIQEKDIDLYIQSLTSSDLLIQELQADCVEYQKHTKIQDIKIPDLYHTSSLQNAVTCHSQLKTDFEMFLKSKRLSNLKLSANKTFDFIEPSIFSDYTEYSTNFSIIQTYLDEMRQLDVQLDTIQTKISNIKICPTCGRPME